MFSSRVEESLKMHPPEQFGKTHHVKHDPKVLEAYFAAKGGESSGAQGKPLAPGRVARGGDMSGAAEALDNGVIAAAECAALCNACTIL